VRFAQLKLGPMANFSYVFGDDAGRGAIVDPGFEPERLLAEADRLGLAVERVLITHGHDDHVRGLDHVVRATRAKVVAHPDSRLPFDVATTHGGAFHVGALEVRAWHTPGHQPDAVSFEVDRRLLFTGDTLFIGECGRADLPGSDPRALHASLLGVLASLPRHLEVYPGHDYGPLPHATLGHEFESNYTLEPRDVEAFVRFMAEP